MIGIYKITNKINGKIYIGQSRYIERRFTEHKRHYKCESHRKKIALYKAMWKYGVENFIFEILEETSVDVLDEREKYYIDFYKSNHKDMGYNLTEGGEHGPIYCGETNKNAKLTEDIVFQIREYYRQGYVKKQAYKCICEKQKVNINTFSDVWVGKIWKHVHYDVYDESLKDEIYRKRCENKSRLTETSSKQYVKEIRDYRNQGRYIWDIFTLYSDKMERFNFEDIWYNRCYKYIQSDIVKESKVKYVKKHKFEDVKINMYNLDGKYIKTFDNAYDVIKFLDRDSTNNMRKNTRTRIFNVCNHKEKSAYGYIWSFVDCNDYQ